MARRNSSFMIGLFVTVGLVIGIAAIIWVGASTYFEKGSLFVTYFDESVQGLQVDSRVKYRGVDIGKVQSIGVAPDRKLVEVGGEIFGRHGVEVGRIGHRRPPRPRRFAVRARSGFGHSSTVARRLRSSRPHSANKGLMCV